MYRMDNVVALYAWLIVISEHALHSFWAFLFYFALKTEQSSSGELFTQKVKKICF